MLDDRQKELLARPLDPRAIATRPGGGGAKLSYIEGHYAVRKANEIFGYGNWSYDIVSLTRNDIDETGNGFYQAMIKLYVCDQATGRPGPPITEIGNCAYRPGKVPQATIDSLDMASKGAVTDAVKRALRNYGDQFGLSLYGDDFTSGDKGPKPETRNTTRPAAKPVARPQAAQEAPGAAKGQQATNSLPPKPIADFETQIQQWATAMRQAKNHAELIAIKDTWKVSVPEKHRRFEELTGIYHERYKAITHELNRALAGQEAQHELEQTGAA